MRFHFLCQGSTDLHADTSSIDITAVLLSQYVDVEFIVVGDFNLVWLKNASDCLKKWPHLFTAHHRTHSRSTVIDLIFSTSIDKLLPVGVWIGHDDYIWWYSSDQAFLIPVFQSDIHYRFEIPYVFLQNCFSVFNQHAWFKKFRG